MEFCFSFCDLQAFEYILDIVCQLWTYRCPFSVCSQSVNLHFTDSILHWRRNYEFYVVKSLNISIIYPYILENIFTFVKKNIARFMIQISCNNFVFTWNVPAEEHRLSSNLEAFYIIKYEFYIIFHIFCIFFLNFLLLYLFTAITNCILLLDIFSSLLLPVYWNYLFYVFILFQDIQWI